MVIGKMIVIKKLKK